MDLHRMRFWWRRSIMKVMTIVINGEETRVPEDAVLSEVLQLFDLPAQRIAVELNRSVVRRTDWDKIRIGANDRIEIIHFVGGG